jgi:MerR family redox-sensitive transcriptional activator SoxR
MNDATLTIGEVAQLVGLRTSAIRYYETIGVLPEPERDSGQRRYTKETVRRLQVIDIAKRAGFSLDDVRLLLQAERDGLPAHEQLRDLAQRKLPDVEALIERAQEMRAWLTTATGCGCQTLDACALFDANAEAAARASNEGAITLSIMRVGS